MNEPVIQPSEFQTRLAALRAAMARENADLFMAFSNLLDPSAVRYFTDFSAVNESGAFLVTGTRATLCSGQASYDYALVKNKLACAEIKVFPEIGEVSGFEYDYGGQMDFADYFHEIAADRQNRARGQADLSRRHIQQAESGVPGCGDRGFRRRAVRDARHQVGERDLLYEKSVRNRDQNL